MQFYELIILQHFSLVKKYTFAKCVKNYSTVKPHIIFMILNKHRLGNNHIVVQ